MRDYGVVVMCGALLWGCGDDGMSDDIVEPTATVTMQVLNGATPVGAARPTRGGGAAADGNWQVSPDELRGTLLGLSFFGEAGTTMVDVADCEVAFELDQPGLAQQLDCEFTLLAGTYVSVMPRWSSEFEVLIDDPTNGIFTDPAEPTKLTGTAPAGGAAMITVGAPGMMNGSGAFFDPPLVVEEGDAITLSILLNALQRFQLNANAGTLTLGADGNGMPGFPDAVVAVGTPASVAYYVNDALGTPLSFGGAIPAIEGPTAVAVLHGGDQQPEFLSQGGSATECPSMVGFVFGNAENGYLGLDDNNVLGWAGKVDGEYTALFRMPVVDDLAGGTTLECAATSTDPMPPGDTFASGAPEFTPARTFAMTLMAN